MLAAEPVARGDLVLQGVHLPLVGDMACVAPVVVGEAVHVADHVRRHARAFDREAVTASVARDPSSPAGAECVAEDPGRLVCHEGVLAPPAWPVPRAKCVDIDEPSVLVEPGAATTRPEPVHGASAVDQASEQMVEAAAP